MNVRALWALAPMSLVAALTWPDEAVLWALQHDWVTESLVSLAAEAESPAAAELGPREPVALSLATEAVAEVDERFLSVAIDSALVAGGKWWAEEATPELMRGHHRTEPLDYTTTELRERTALLSPAYLRIGGTEADHLYYAMGDDPPEVAPPPYEVVFTAERWDSTVDFCEASGLDLFFTLNAGPGARDELGAWQSDNAEALLDYAKRRGDDVPVWELGNELNVHRWVHGAQYAVTGEQAVQDMRRFNAVVKARFPEARVVGPAAFLWPQLGEPLADKYGVLQPFVDGGGLRYADALTWHFYPQQSRRCFAASRRAHLTRLLDPGQLDEFGRWADHMNGLASSGGVTRPVWMGETGNAQCGGEPGVSDRFVGGLWWVDQLGLAARRGQQIVVRQTLIGSHYGLLDEKTLDPHPDYWNSLLWKRLMGTRVLDVQRMGRDRRLRSYAHCTPESFGAPAGAVTMLLVNLGLQQSAVVDLGAFDLRDAQVFELSADALDAEQIALNGKPLQARDLPDAWLGPAPLRAPEGRYTLPATRYSFVVVPNAGAAACR